MEAYLTVALLFLMGAQFGMALASSIIVHPILKIVSGATAIEVFKPFFHKTHNTMISFSIIVTILAFIISLVSRNWWWVWISLLMHLNGPYTLLLMMPLNRRLMEQDVDPQSEKTKSDLIKWGGLHAIRTFWNGGIFTAFLILAIFGV